MHKIWLIARREFLSRVQKKSFLLTTILLPLFIFGFYALIIYFAIKPSDTIHIAISDKGNVFGGKIADKNDIVFTFANNQTFDSLKAQVTKKEIDGFVVVPAAYTPGDSLSFVSGKTIGPIVREKIQGIFNSAFEEQRLLSLHISKQELDSLQKENNIKFSTLEGKEENGAKVGISYAVGYISGFLIYIVLFIYGTMVMRGVMEEKTNRIAEVIISSVKPFQLMFGKITGIGAVGLVQFSIWGILVVGLQLLLPVFFPGLAAQMHSQPIQPAGAQVAEVIKTGEMNSFMTGLHQINFGMIVGCFIFYFFAGYLLYSSLFAAVGSAVNDDPQDAQSLLLPITMPIIFAIIIMTKAVNDPSSGLAVFGSLFPLTSPIVMMARIPFGVPNTVPYWQLITSMVLLILGFLFTTWLSGKIYRTGILMYGKKTSWKEMWKWAFRKS